MLNLFKFNKFKKILNLFDLKEKYKNLGINSLFKSNNSIFNDFSLGKKLYDFNVILLDYKVFSLNFFSLFKKFLPLIEFKQIKKFSFKDIIFLFFTIFPELKQIYLKIFKNINFLNTFKLKKKLYFKKKKYYIKFLNYINRYIKFYSKRLKFDIQNNNLIFLKKLNYYLFINIFEKNEINLKNVKKNNFFKKY